MVGRKGFLSARWRKDSRQGSTFRILILILILISQLVIFLPHVGRGFISDDFVWIDSMIHEGRIDILRPFKETTGFFRPLVGLSFGIQYRLHGLNPRPFGLFNLFVHMLNIILVFLLLSGNKRSKPYAIFASLLFALNAKGAHHAVGWISGRTSLMFTFFLLLSFYVYTKIKKGRNLRVFLTACLYFAALLSKETAVAAPLFVFVYGFLSWPRGKEPADYRKRIKAGLSTASVFFYPLLLYFIFRFNSNAMSPFNAPDCYTYNLSPLRILENICEYIIRAGLLDIYILLFLICLTLVTGKKEKKEKSIDASTLFWSLLWFLIFLLPLLPLPYRSDLYTYFPQIGLHIASVTIISHLWKNLDIKKGLQRYLIYALTCILSITWSGYLLTKADSNAKKGECSALFTRQVVRVVSTKKPGSKIVIIDRHHQEEYTPAKVVYYGFPSLLDIYFPGQKFRGEITTPHHKPEPKEYDPTTYYFTWQNGCLTPLNEIN